MYICVYFFFLMMEFDEDKDGKVCMCVCMYVCMYVGMYVCVCVCVCVRVCVYDGI